MRFKPSPLSAVDSYKLNHRLAEPEGTESNYANLTPRSVKHLNIPSEYKTNKVVWFGGQAVVRDMLEFWQEEFFDVIDGKIVTKVETIYVDGVALPTITTHLTTFEETLQKFKKLITPFAGPDYDVQHLRDLHKLGYLPLEIKQLPEGSYVNVNVPFQTYESTGDKYAWLSTYIETELSSEIWRMPTSATTAAYYKKIATKWYEKTGSDFGFLPFAFHDFSYRGLSGIFDSCKSGAAHLTSFMGSDTIPAVEYLNYHYDGLNTFVAASVFATEHSIQTAYQNDDYTYFKRMITEVCPTGIASIVCDGYDYWNVLLNVLPRLKEVILNRPVDALGLSKVVIRPDSGDPVRIIAGYRIAEFDSEAEANKQWLKNYNDDVINFEVAKIGDKYYTFDEEGYWEYGPSGIKNFKEITEHEAKGSIEVLWKLFGGTLTSKGYKKLDSHIGLIYGDSITLARSDEIFSRLEEKGFSSDNVVFGVGSYTYAFVTRDTLGLAVKATNTTIFGKRIALFKNPKTDDGTKKSAKGYLMVIKNGDDFVLVDQVTKEQEQSEENLLKTIYKDGKTYFTETVVTVRERLANGSL